MTAPKVQLQHRRRRRDIKPNKWAQFSNAQLRRILGRGMPRWRLLFIGREELISMLNAIDREPVMLETAGVHREQK